MVARAAALRTNINIDGRPLPTKKRRRSTPSLTNIVINIIISRPHGRSYHSTGGVDLLAEACGVAPTGSGCGYERPQ